MCAIVQKRIIGHTYDYVEVVESTYIKKFLPIHFVVTIYGKVKITLNLFNVDLDGKYVYVCRHYTRT